jgi:hypothetical protein
MAARFPSGCDTIARRGHRNDFVGLSVKDPQRRDNRASTVIRRYASASDHRGGKEVWTIREHIPNARASHRVPGNIDTAFFDSKLAAQSIDDLKRQARAIPEAGEF